MYHYVFIYTAVCTYTDVCLPSDNRLYYQQELQRQSLIPLGKQVLFRQLYEEQEHLQHRSLIPRGKQVCFLPFWVKHPINVECN